MDMLLALLLQVTAHRQDLPNIKDIPQTITITLESFKEPLPKKVAVKQRAKTKVVPTKRISGGIQCVQYARQATGIQLYGNANTWAKQAASKGYTVTNTPKVGAVLSEPRLSKDGHVSVVIASAPGTITVREANYVRGKITTRTIKLSGKENFITQ